MKLFCTYTILRFEKKAKGKPLFFHKKFVKNVKCEHFIGLQIFLLF